MEPWKLRKSDLRVDGYHIESGARLAECMLFFEYLRCSPSYRLAKLAALGKLPSGTKTPTYFAEVQRTYALLGDVDRVLFRFWWRDRGIRVFGTPSPSAVQQLAKVPAGAVKDPAALHAAVDRYLGKTRPAQSNPGILMLALPLNMSKADILKQVAYLAEHHGAAKPKLKPVLAIGDRVRQPDLTKGVRLLWFHAGGPDKEPWRLGALAELGHQTTRDKHPKFKLDANAPRSVSEPAEVEARETMSKVTRRALQRAEMRAENAARGRFPSDEVIDHSLFDYRQLGQRIRSSRVWTKKEQKRLLDEQQARLNGAA